MTAGALANVITINEKLLRLITEQTAPRLTVHSNTLFQGTHDKSLGWPDAFLQNFLETSVQSMFGVLILKKEIRFTMNGDAQTVGDLSIAIFTAIQKRQKPKHGSTLAYF